MGITFGNVPEPFARRIINKPTGWREGTRTIRGVCLHSMVGYLAGTENYFKNPNEPHGWNVLTDFGIGGSVDGDLDGAVWMWNEPTGRRIPASNNWGSLAEKEIKGDGVAFVERYGEDAINGDLASIERSDGGDVNTPVSARQFEAICQTAAWVIDQARIPWHVWPFNNDGVKAIYWHNEFVTKGCPFDPVKGRTSEIIDRVGAILKHAQQSGRPTYVRGEKPPDFDGTDKQVNGVLFHAERRTVKVAVEELNCRAWAALDAPLSRAPLKQGQGFRVVYWVTGENVAGEDRWWVTPAGSRIWVGGTVQQPTRTIELLNGARGASEDAVA